jgi:D-sedoheptulose 7-phosphate isomerase
MWVRREKLEQSILRASFTLGRARGLRSGPVGWLWRATPPATIGCMNPKDPVRASFEEASRVLATFLADPACLESVHRFIQAAAKTLKAGGLLMSCGNGGSMCDAMHFAEEWTGRFRRDRSALPAIAFSDPSQLTCIANDFGYDEVFARLVEAYGKKGDLLVALSTSGDSKNILRALEVARSKGIGTVGLLGKGGGQARNLVDISIVVPLATTSDRIQEVHIKVLHIAIEAVEREMFPANYSSH